MKRIQGELCKEAMGDELKYMGTTNVVYDIREMKKWFDPLGKMYVTAFIHASSNTQSTETTGVDRTEAFSVLILSTCETLLPRV